MNRFPLLTIGAAAMLAAFWSAGAPAADEAKGPQALLNELGKSKVSLREGVQQAAKAAGVPISAKFELEDGKLSLSVYTAEKGLAVPAEKNVLEELSGSPESEWKPGVELFKDVPHVARSSEQLTLMALGKASLADIIARVEKAQSGTVFSVTPMVRNHRPVVEVLVAEKGKVKRVFQPL